MIKNNRLSIVLTILLVVALASACSAKPTEDPNLKITEIANTVQAELTQNALLTPSATATLEPTPTETPAPPTPTVDGTLFTATATIRPTFPVGTSGDNSKFIGDVTYPDGTVVTPREKITKTWKFQNTGTTTWTTAYSIIYLEGNLLGANGALSFKLTKDVPPGEIAEISASFIGPLESGTYKSLWKLYSPNGFAFGEFASILVVVGSASPSGTATATSAGESTPNWWQTQNAP